MIAAAGTVLTVLSIIGALSLARALILSASPHSADWKLNLGAWIAVAACFWMTGAYVFTLLEVIPDRLVFRAAFVVLTLGTAQRIREGTKFRAKAVQALSKVVPNGR